MKRRIVALTLGLSLFGALAGPAAAAGFTVGPWGGFQDRHQTEPSDGFYLPAPWRPTCEMRFPVPCD